MKQVLIAFRIRYRLELIFLIPIISLLALSCRSPEGVSITEAWGRPSPRSAANAAFYMNIKNHEPQTDSLIGADIDICGSTKLHESIVDGNGVMRMHHVDKVDLPSGSTIRLEPGGLHIMCIDRQVDLLPGNNFDIILEFSNIGSVSVKATIRDQ